jgi:Outer membrane protein beta-barrel domain
MIDRKKIEDLFQQKLNDFEVSPPDEIWASLEIELQKKKEKRRVIPFWWKLSGIAAVLVIGISLLTTVSNDESNDGFNSKTNSSVTSNGNSEENKNQVDAANEDGSETNATKINTNPNNTVAEVETKESNSNQQKLNNAPSIKENSSVVNQESQKSKSSSKNDDKLLNNKNAVAKSDSKISLSSSVNSSKSSTTKEAVANNSSTTSRTKKNQNTTKIVHNNNERIVLVPSKENNTTTENKSVIKNNQVTLIPENKNLNDKIAMKNHTDLVETKGELVKKIDSTSIANVEPNAMEELQNEKEKKSTQKQKINRWQVTPNLAPVYFGSLQNGSPLDESLNNNDKNYNNTISYGVSVNYALNKKVKVRTGVNVFSVDYDTRGIVFYQDMNAKMMKNIDPTLQGSMIQIKPLNNVSTELNRVVSERFDGVLNQKMGFIEMPFELSYTILNRKLGVEVLGGFSTLFLNKNEIFLRTEGLNTKIGTANNLNDIHFSTNLGIGIQYKLFKNFDARLEPTFKYQLNTFSNGSNEFRPYIFGVYSGVSYRF